jgi:TRAP transporter TAXI family solute receptor
MLARDSLRSHWPTVALIATAAVIVVAAFMILRSMPPRLIVMATGPEGGTYYELGQRYRAVLARDKVEVQLVPTAGSVENVAMLLDPRSEVSASMVQSGIVGKEAKSELESLGTLFYEPAWWFRRREIQGVGVPSLRGRRISIGPEGSGTRQLMFQLLKRVGLADDPATQLLSLPPRAAREKLLAGEIDVAFILASWESPLVQQLLADEPIELANYARPDAFVALYPFLSKLVVPRGAADLLRDRPPADVVLLATKASLMIRKDLHPAIQYLLLQAAQEIHSGPSIFNKPSEFPAAESIDVPLSSEAQRFYKSGLPFLREYLPFWMATLVGQLIVVFIPVLGILYPIIKFLPRVYDWAIRSKVLRMYGELRFLEHEMANAAGTGRNPHDIVKRLDRLHEQVHGLKMPIAYTRQTEGMLSVLQDHIVSVRESANQHLDKLVEKNSGAG